MWQRLTLVVLTIFVAPLAYGHESGTPYADWIRGLKQPHSPTTSCCGVADQYFVKDYRPSQQSGMAFIARVINNKSGFPDFEIEVPEHTIMHNQHNPTGRGVIFVIDPGGFERYRYVVCFVPETGI